MMMSNHRDDNLPEVVPDSSPQALSQAEIYSKYGFDGGEGKYPYGFDGEKYVSPITPSTVHRGGFGPNYGGYSYSGEPEGHMQGASAPAEERRILGVKRRIFWIIVLVILAIILAIAIGTGVGLTRGSGSSDSSGSDSEEQQGATSTTGAPSSTPAPEVTSSSEMPSSSSSSMSSSTSTSSSEAPQQTFLNNMTRPEGFAFQAFSEKEYMGNATEVYKQRGFTNLPWDVWSYVWLQNDTDCCLAFCQSTNRSGWRCDDREQPESSGPFDRIFIGCGNDATEERLRCTDE